MPSGFGGRITTSAAWLRRGADPLAAKVATAAVLAALTVALFDWSLRDESALGDAITAALDIVEGARG